MSGKRFINSVLYKYIICCKLHEKLEKQDKANLPPERLKICPPLTVWGSMSLDLGPLQSDAPEEDKRRASGEPLCSVVVMLSLRALHVEVMESVDASSCMNALRRFFALRGPKQLHSDCGTNLAGTCNELRMDKRVRRRLSEQGCSWDFYPAHSSDTGGSQESLIGVARRILDSMLLQQKTHLNHEVLYTLMVDVTAITNVSADPQLSFILSPSVLLTQKAGVPPPPGDSSDKDLNTKQRRQAQALTNPKLVSRACWSKEYLPSLQQRQK